MQFVTIDQYIIYGTIVILMFAVMRRMHVTALWLLSCAHKMQGLTHGDRPKITTPPSRCKNWGKVLIKKHQPYFIDHWEGTLNVGRLLAPLSPSLKPRHAWQPNSWVMINSLYPFRLNDATHEFAPLQCFAGLRRIASKFSSLQWYTSGEQMWIHQHLSNWVAQRCATLRNGCTTLCNHGNQNVNFYVPNPETCGFETTQNHGNPEKLRNCGD